MTLVLNCGRILQCVIISCQNVLSCLDFLFKYMIVTCHRLILQVHGSLEILALLVIAFELGMKVKWLGIRMFVCHIRTMIKVLFLATLSECKLS